MAVAILLLSGRAIALRPASAGSVLGVAVGALSIRLLAAPAILAP